MTVIMVMIVVMVAVIVVVMGIMGMLVFLVMSLMTLVVVVAVIVVVMVGNSSRPHIGGVSLVFGVRLGHESHFTRCFHLAPVIENKH